MPHRRVTKCYKVVTFRVHCISFPNHQTIVTCARSACKHTLYVHRAAHCELENIQRVCLCDSSVLICSVRKRSVIVGSTYHTHTCTQSHKHTAQIWEGHRVFFYSDLICHRASVNKVLYIISYKLSDFCTCIVGTIERMYIGELVRPLDGSC